MLIIRHRRGLLGWWPPYFKTVVSDEGILITRFLRTSRLLRWSEIQCLDLGGLEVKDYTWLPNSRARRSFEKANRLSRSFLIMIPDARPFADGTLKNWYASSNVLGLTQIRTEDVAKLKPELTRQAVKHGILLDTIVLGGDEL